jgi:tetraacyldisaccharide 4'-kinase
MGDEAFLMAESLPGVPVIVGKDRHAGGKLALETLRSDVVVLDDGFQHLALKKDMTFLVFDGTKDPRQLALLPFGTLREPLSVGRKADVIIASKVNLADGALSIKESLACLYPNLPILSTRYECEDIHDLHSQERKSCDALRGRPVVVLSALGNTRGFVALVRNVLGADVKADLCFSDHHIYNQRDVSRAEEALVSTVAERIVTTEKDAVKLRSLQLSPEKWMAARLRVSFEREDDKKFTKALLGVFECQSKA